MEKMGPNLKCEAFHGDIRGFYICVPLFLSRALGRMQHSLSLVGRRERGAAVSRRDFTVSHVSDVLGTLCVFETLAFAAAVCFPFLYEAVRAAFRMFLDETLMTYTAVVGWKPEARYATQAAGSVRLS